MISRLTHQNYGNLSINGQNVNSPDIAANGTKGLSGSTLKIKSSLTNSLSNTSGVLAQKNKSVAENFRNNLLASVDLANNKNTDINKRTIEENEAFVDSMVDFVDEVKNQFSQEIANDLMAHVLTNTKGGFSESRITGAVGEVFKKLKNTYLETLAKKDVTEEEASAAQKGLDELKEFVVFLNGESEEDSSEDKSITNSFNEYFGKDKFMAGDLKKFTEDFDWLSEKEIADMEEAKGNTRNGVKTEFKMTVKEFGRDNLTDLVKFLRNDLESEEAASLIENLADTDDIFDAMDDVREILYEETELVANNASMGFLTDWNTIQKNGGAFHREGPGLEKKARFDQFLDLVMVDKVNKVISDDESVKARFTQMALDDKHLNADEIPDGYGIANWPGATSFGFLLCYNKNFWESDKQAGYRAFNVAEVGDSTAEERWQNQVINNSVKIEGLSASFEDLTIEQKQAKLAETTLVYEDMKKAAGFYEGGEHSLSGYLVSSNV